MVVNDDLLQVALARRDEFERVQDEAESARASFHRSIQHLYVDGATLREIAEAFGLSHQRVHQIVEGTEPAAAPDAGSEGDLACSFCRRHQSALRKLVAGGAAWICDDCATVVRGVDRGTESPEVVVDGDGSARCDFCGKRGRKSAGLLRGTGAGAPRICRPCLDLVEEILQADARSEALAPVD